MPDENNKLSKVEEIFRQYLAQMRELENEQNVILDEFLAVAEKQKITKTRENLCQ